MQYTSSNSTIESKESFERDCMTQNVVPKNYYADNGGFAENTKKKIVKKNATSYFL